MEYSRLSRTSLGYNSTDRGTPIVKPGEDMDKNTFLKILSAQLRNQDPMSGDQDSTQYVTQMAQFTTMEQMQNLNKTMTSYSHQNLVGKGVTVDVADSNGNPYTGIVKSVKIEGGKTSISVEVAEDGKNVYKEFPVESILSVLEVPDFSLPTINNMNGNTSFLLASSFIGKDVVLSEKDSSDNNYEGKVIAAFKEEGLIKVNVELKGSKEVIAVTLDKVMSVKEAKEESDAESEGEELKLSKHAMQRMQQLRFDNSDYKNIEDGIEKARLKGARNTVLIYKDTAVIASVENNTVITAVDKNRADDNVFTNIDSAVIL